MLDLNKLLSWIDNLFASILSVGRRLLVGLTGLGTLIVVVVFILIIFQTINSVKGGHPEAWKENAGKLIIAAVAAAVLAVFTVIAMSV